MADIPTFRPGQKLTAADMNTIASMIVRQFRGIPPVSVKRIAGGILIGLGNVRQRTPGTDTVIARLATDDGGGNYTWNKERGDGPDIGTAVELTDLEGLPVGEDGAIVTLYKSEGVWVFQKATAGDLVVAQFLRSDFHSQGNSSNDLDGGAFVYNQSGFTQSTYFIYAPQDGLYRVLVSVHCQGTTTGQMQLHLWTTDPYARYAWLATQPVDSLYHTLSGSVDVPLVEGQGFFCPLTGLLSGTFTVAQVLISIERLGDIPT